MFVKGWPVVVGCADFFFACMCLLQAHICIDIFVYVYVHGCVSTCNSHVDSEHPNKQCAHLTRAFASCPAGCWCEQVPIFLGKRRDICMMVRFLALHVVWVCVGVAGAGVASVRADDPISRPANPKNLTVISLRPVNLSSTLVNKNSADAAGGELCARSMPCNCMRTASKATQAPYCAAKHAVQWLPLLARPAAFPLPFPFSHKCACIR
jgi:hypothetical protein